MTFGSVTSVATDVTWALVGAPVPVYGAATPLFVAPGATFSHRIDWSSDGRVGVPFPWTWSASPAIVRLPWICSWAPLATFVPPFTAPNARLLMAVTTPSSMYVTPR